MQCSRLAFALCFFALTGTLGAQSPVPFEIYPGHPRVFFRETGDAEHTGRADLLLRIGEEGNWKSVWDNVIIPWCDRNVTVADADLVENSDSTADKVLTFAFAGWITGNTAYRQKAIDLGMYISGMSLDYITDATHARWGVMSLACVYDILHDDSYMTESRRQAMGARIVELADYLANRDDQRIGGHTHGDQAVQLIGMTAIAGEISGWDSRLEEALHFWYDPGTGYIETLRYFCQDGGHMQGSWYGYLVAFHDLWLFTALTNGTENLRPFAEEAWLSRIPEWYLNVGLRGDGDMFTICDTARPSEPLLHNSARSVLTILADRFQNAQARWLYDTLDEIGQQRGDGQYAPNLVYDVIFLDKSRVAPVSPRSVSSPYPRTRLFETPGAFFYRDTWDYPQSTIVHIDVTSDYTMWHQHLACGSMQIAWRDDMVLLGRGLYSGGNTGVGDEHHRNWYQRSIAHSGVPLVYNPYEVYERWGERSDVPEDRIGNDGGQHWKKYTNGGERRSVPYNLQNLLNDGGGLAWYRGAFTHMEEDEDYVFLHADIAPAYLKEYNEVPRVEQCECRWLILKRAAANPMILCYHQVRSANAAWRKAIPWHFTGYPSINGGRISANGVRNHGRCVLDVLYPESYDFTIVGGGVEDALGYGAYDFWYEGENWPPDVASNDRNLPDVGKYRVEVAPRTATEYDEFVTLLMPMGVGESPPVYSWIDEADWYGIDIGGVQYRISKVGSVVTKDGTGSTPVPEVIIVDNGDPETSSTGNWNVSGGANPYGVDSLYSRDGSTYTYTVPLGTPGTYELDAWWTTYPSRSESVPYEVEHAGGTTTVHVDQTTGGGQWMPLGSFSFETAATVRILALGSPSTCADAIRLTLPDGGGGSLPPTATILSIEPNPVLEGEKVTFEGAGEDPDGGTISEYRWVSDLDGDIGNRASFFTRDLTPGIHRISLTVTDDEGSVSAPDEQELVVEPLGGFQEIILDDGQPGTSYTGNWKASGGSEPYGTQSLYCKDTGAAYTYTFSLGGTADCDVYAWWTEYPSRATAVPIEVQHSSGTATITVNQQEGGGQWNLLGSFTFGSTAVVRVVSVGGSASTCADAIRLVGSGTAPPPPPPPPPTGDTIIIDNGDAGTSSSGYWKVSGGADPYGVDSLYAKQSGSYSYTAAVSGTYNVYAWWTEYSSRGESVPITIEHSGGSATVHVNQQLNGGQWNLLGAYTFEGDATVTVTVVGSTSTCADAVKLEPAP